MKYWLFFTGIILAFAGLLCFSGVVALGIWQIFLTALARINANGFWSVDGAMLTFLISIIVTAIGVLIASATEPTDK
jgi:hypothetical protein